MEVRIAVALDIRRTNPRIPHDGGGTAGFVGCGGNTLAVLVLRVIATKLMPDLMRHIVDVKRIACGRIESRGAPCLIRIIAQHGQACTAATAHAEDMTDVV